MNYRKDIDGLRALAVVPVVLYHAGFTLFSGGFVGVDVFFVISGFLITGIIAGEVHEERFSVLRFYERRIRRIFPALFGVLVFTSIVGLIVLLPDELRHLGKSTIAASLFSSNILFWRESGYFDTASELKPLLHTWSLAVEEQFYIFFPLFLMLTWRWRLPWRALTWTGLFLSLALSMYGIRHYDEATFYLLPTRAWELLIGTVIALGAVPRIRHQLVAEAISGLGLVFILIAVFAYDRSTPFPGETALLPCLGAAFIIYAGLEGRQTKVGWLLGLGPLVFIGLISYSLYLWHWPLIVYTKLILIHPITIATSSSIVVVSFIAAVISWRYVETPFRVKSVAATRSQVLAFGISGMALFITASSAILATGGIPSRIPPEAADYASTMSERKMQWQRYDCAISRLLPNYKYGPCLLNGNANKPPRTLVWGDSHAMALKPMFEDVFSNINQKGYLISTPGCSPLINLERIAYELPCAAYATMVMKFISKIGIKKVILVGSWNGIFYEKNTIFEGKRSFNDETRFENVKTALRQTVNTLNNSGVKVAFLMPTPGASADVPGALARAKLLDRKAGIEISKTEYQARIKKIREIISVQQKSEVQVFSTSDSICKEKCAVEQNGHALYFDNNHPSLYFNKILLNILEPRLQEFIEEGSF